MKVWDADAIIMTLKEPAGDELLAALVLRQELNIGGSTITELLASPPRTQAEADMLDALTGSPSVYVEAEREDYRAAGLWLRNIRVTGTSAERKNQRARLTLDALLASLAWRRGASAVTLNRKDFARIAQAAGREAGIFMSPGDAVMDMDEPLLGLE